MVRKRSSTTEVNNNEEYVIKKVSKGEIFGCYGIIKEAFHRTYKAVVKKPETCIAVLTKEHYTRV